MKKFCCKTIRKEVKNKEYEYYFVGVALLASGGIDFYYDFRRVYSHEFDIDQTFELPSHKKENQTFSSEDEKEIRRNIHMLKCVDINMDFENIYCKFVHENTDGKERFFTTRIPNSWERELSTYTMQDMIPFVNFEPVTPEERRNLDKVNWFANDHCVMSSVANYCGLYSKFLISGREILIAHNNFVSIYDLEKKAFGEHHQFDDVVRTMFDN